MRVGDRQGDEVQPEGDALDERITDDPQVHGPR
jgi:hypothetical protein